MPHKRTKFINFSFSHWAYEVQLQAQIQMLSKENEFHKKLLTVVRLPCFLIHIKEYHFGGAVACICQSFIIL